MLLKILSPTFLRENITEKSKIIFSSVSSVANLHNYPIMFQLILLFYWVNLKEDTIYKTQLSPIQIPLISAWNHSNPNKIGPTKNKRETIKQKDCTISYTHKKKDQEKSQNVFIVCHYWYRSCTPLVADGGDLAMEGCDGGAVRAYVSLEESLSIRPATPAAADWALEGRKRSCLWSL